MVREGITMEWLEHYIIRVAIGVIIAYHWYDKKERDKRFVKLEERMAKADTQASKQQTQLEVMNVELQSFSKVTDVRLSHIQDGLDKVVDLIERQNEKRL